VDEVTAAAGGTVLRTRIGAPIVARVMFDRGAAFGGEENGGVIFPAHQFCRDGAMAAAKMLELLALSRTSASELVASLPSYHMSKGRVHVPADRREAVLKALEGLVSGRNVETLDGVKIREADGWVLVRPSGTESIFRVYADARSQARAEALKAEGLSLIARALKES